MKKHLAALIFFFSLVFISCEEQKDPESYVTLNGTNSTWTQSGVSWLNSSIFGYSVAYSTTFIQGASYPRIVVRYGNHFYFTYSSSDFYNFFTTGYKIFSFGSNTAGITIFYYAAPGGPRYSTAAGSQLGSYANLGSVNSNSGSFSVHDRVHYTLDVNAKLYNMDIKGDYIPVTALFNGYFEEYQ